MLELNFDFIWKTFIKKSIENFIVTISEEEKQKYKIIIRDQRQIKKQVYKDYEAQRNLLKKRYYDGSISNGKIDEHKITACLCYSLIKNKSIEYKLVENLPLNILFANYQIAYNSSIGIVFGYLLDFYSSKNNNKEFEILSKNQSVFLPSTSEEHDDYDICIIKMLTLNDLYGNSFDLLAYSNIMFCLEEYNKTYISSNINK
jgi:hypothetical protein